MSDDRSLNDEALASAFPAATREQWRALVDRAIKGADFDKALTSRTYDDIAIAPLYTKAEGTAQRAIRATAGPWRIHQRVDHPDPREANKLALADLEGGAHGLVLVMGGAATARGFGLETRHVPDALEGIALDPIHLRMEHPATARFSGEDAKDLGAWLKRTGIDPLRLSIH